MNPSDFQAVFDAVGRKGEEEMVRKKSAMLLRGGGLFIMAPHH